MTENDGYINPYIDEYYTAGNQIGLSTKEFDFSKNKAMKWTSYLGFFNKSPRVTRFGISLAQDMYTLHLKTENWCICDDNHPYGGIWGWIWMCITAIKLSWSYSRFL